MPKQSGAEQKLMPITGEQEAALFERPFRAQETNAPHGCRLELHFSSMLRLQGRLSSILRLRSRLERHPSSILRLRGRFDRHFSNILRLRGGLERHFEPSVAPGRARAAISSHLRFRARLERPDAANSGISGQAGHEALNNLKLRDPEETL